MIVSNFTKLFSIEFLHDFYKDSQDAFRNNELLDEILQDISITADVATQAILNGYHIIYKAHKNKLLCFVQTKALIDTSGGSLQVIIENKPLITFDEDTLLNFRITINSPGFLNNSNLRRFKSKDRILLFGNNSGNKNNALLTLSNKIPVYDNTQTYEIGMLTVNAANQLFEAIQRSDPAHAHDTSDIQYWRQIADFAQYVSQADLTDDTAEQKCFGIISISFNKNLSNDFSLLKKSNIVAQNDTILGKEYTIHFKNSEAI